MDVENKKICVIVSGLIIGIIATILVTLGNPANMGLDSISFLRDTMGALGFHQTAGAQYIRPELIGLVWGALILAVLRKQYHARGGSAPLVRFVVGFFVAIGAMVFMGDPFRMLMRIGGGDWTAIVGLVGFIVGAAIGAYFLNRGFTLPAVQEVNVLESAFMPILKIVLLILLLVAPTFIVFSSGEDIGAIHASIIISLIGGLIIGAIAQQMRFCFANTFRSLFLEKNVTMLLGWIGVLVAIFIVNGITHQFHSGVDMQPFANTDALWNFLGMVLVGWGCILIGGDPIRQLVRSGEGDTDAAITVIGMATGAALSENFALSSTVSGATPTGQIAVIIGIIVVLIISGYYSCKTCRTSHQEG